MLVLDDQEIRAHLTPQLAMDAARRALIDAHEGTLVGDPRVYAPAGAADFAFTVGGYENGPLGFRAYARWRPLDYDNQAVLVWDADHTLRAIATGRELGLRRNGAFGGVAVDALARPDAATVGIVGAGVQAAAHLWAIVHVREVREVRVFRRNADERHAFATRIQDVLDVACRPVDSAREAVQDNDVVILSTGAQEPVIDTSWVTPGTHVTTTSMAAGSRETPPELIERASVIVSGSPRQSIASDDFGLLAGKEVVHLGAVLNGDAPGRIADDDITLCWSTGLAGSEVVTLAALTDDAPL